MLKFNREERANIGDIERSWSSLAREFAGSIGPSVVRHSSKWEQIKNHLRAVAQNETRLTRKQLDKIISDYDVEKPVDEELKQFLKTVKETVVTH